MRHVTRSWFLLWCSFALALAGCGSGSQSTTFRSTDVTGAEFGKDFQLSDFNGQQRTLADYRGKVLVVFFGYTHCPDVCPTTLTELANAIKKLGADGDKVQVALITADPERDTEAVLKQYLTAFNPGFIGLRGTPEQTEKVAKDFEVLIQKNPGSDAANYTVDHSSGTYIYDPSGRLRLYVSYGQGADVFAHDIGKLLKS
ncbi:MAG: SCO family protein [Betaproteobacteria bacterium]